MTERQVKEIIKLLKSKELVTRPALQQVFESEGYLWATDGYVAFEIAEVNDVFKDACTSLDDLLKWSVSHQKGELYNGFKKLEQSVPDMCKLLHCGTYDTITKSPKFDIKKIKQCCDFLNCTQFTVKVNSYNEHLYQVIPIDDKMTPFERSMDSKAYIMGLK